MLSRLIKRLQQLNAKLSNFIKWGLSKSRLIDVIFAISRVESQIEQIKNEEKKMTIVFGSAFLPTPSEIEAFERKVKGLIPHKKISSKQHIKLLDVLKHIVETAKTALLKNDLSKEDVIKNLNQIEQCPIWFDTKEIEQIDNFSINEVCGFIETWQDTIDNWDKAFKSITKDATEKIQSQCDLLTKSDIEKATQWIDKSELYGTDKQREWAWDIMENNVKYIAFALKNQKELSDKSWWWIDNRNNLSV